MVGLNGCGVDRFSSTERKRGQRPPAAATIHNPQRTSRAASTLSSPSSSPLHCICPLRVHSPSAPRSARRPSSPPPLRPPQLPQRGAPGSSAAPTPCATPRPAWRLRNSEEGEGPGVSAQQGGKWLRSRQAWQMEQSADAVQPTARRACTIVAAASQPLQPNQPAAHIIQKLLGDFTHRTWAWRPSSRAAPAPWQCTPRPGAMSE